ncbi:MAG: hypothetical protein AAGK32_03145 [Actinomycetota bacterium]
MPERRWLPWAVGLVAGVLVLGPALGSGSLFNLDLIITPDVPLPNGFWGLGPELPRRVPFMVPVAWLSPVLGGELAGKLLMLTTIVLGVVGAHRLSSGAAPVARYAAGLLYGAGPFLVTRVAVGHFNVALAAAILPWALPSLLRPGRDLRRTFLWAAALSVAGVVGGVYAGVVVLVGVLADREPRWIRTIAVVGLAQLSWLVSGLVLIGSGVDPAASSVIATRIDGVLGPARIVMGQGFWQRGLEVGTTSVPVALAGVGLVVLAWLGRRRVIDRFGRRLAVVAGIGLAIAVAGALPLVDGLVVDLTASPVGAVLRDGHRMLPLALIVVVVGAAHGATVLADRADRLAPVAAVSLLAVALVAVGPALGGAGGQLDPVAIPDDWAEARAAIREDPGPVLALPWSQYFNLPTAGGRRSHHPLPIYLGGDVLIASDPQLGEPASERADPREPQADAIVTRARSGRPVASDLADLGVRWVAVLHASDWTSYDGVLEDPGLDSVVSGPEIDLFEVPGWEPDQVDPVLGPLARATGDSNAGIWHRPGGRGWLQGTRAVITTPEGQAALAGGSSLLWYWPAVLVLAGYAVWVVAVAWTSAQLVTSRVPSARQSPLSVSPEGTK